MADDVWTALVKGTLVFTHSRAGEVVGDSFSDTGSLVTSLFDSSPAGTAKTRLDQLKKDIANGEEVAKPVVDAVKPEVLKGKTAVVAMAGELGTSPFTMEAAARAATELGKVLQALDRAMDIVAKEIAKPSPEPERTQIERDIKGIKEPWIKPFRSLAGDATKLFDSLCRQLLGVDDAGQQLQELLVWNDAEKRISMELLALGPRSPVPALTFDGAKVEAFFTFKTEAKLGVVVTTKLKAGLRGDKLLEKIIPGQPPTADSSDAAITLDTLDGLTLGNKDSKITLPVRFAFPGVELREMALALPVDADEKRAGKLDVTLTIAAKMGVVAMVAEGAGVTITLQQNGADAFSVAPRLPDGVGMRVNAGVVKGGGYLRRKETEFGGVLDLQFTTIGITAIGLLGTEPFSLVIVIGVRFAPKIELGFGFTLNGLGGILAIERRLDSAALRKGIREGVVDTLLFPDDPVAAAPKILDKLAAIFPVQPGAFVIGPIAQLGWGSQAGFVKAKVGIVLCLPDPKLVVLGALEVAVPSTEVPDEIKIIQLRAEVFGEFTPDYLLILVSINSSKIAGIPITGDLGLFIRWAGEAAFAMSVGGFFPKYKAPAELSDMRRIAVDLSPSGTKWLTIRAEGYFAVTSNTVQFGGAVRLTADLSVASAKAWLSIDALFQWSPRFYFIVIIDAGIEVRAFGKTIAGVTFHGELQGTTPWRIEGRATVEILFWDVDVDIGPLEWGERDASTGVELSPVAVVSQALAADSAWTTLMPAGTDTLARLVRDESTTLLVHPLGALELRQQRVPLEVEIDRIGSASVTAKRVNLTNPQVGSVPAAVVAHAEDFFPAGHFLKLTQDEQAARPDFERFASGMQVSASREPLFGGAAAVGVPYAWETVFPHEEFGRGSGSLRFGNISRLAFRTSAVSTASRARGNAYMPAAAAPADTLKVADFGRVVVRRSDDLTAPAGAIEIMTTTEAARRMGFLADAAEDTFALVAAGVVP